MSISSFITALEVLYSWFKSYFSNKKQYVSIKNCRPSMSNITLGVLQGSVMAQSFFYVYQWHTCIDPEIRCVWFILLRIQQFLHSVSDINNVDATVNRELVGGDNWLMANRFCFNVSKTTHIIISKQKNSYENITIRGQSFRKFTQSFLYTGWNFYF